VQLKPSFKAAKKDSVLELYMYDDIGASWFSEGITSASVTAALKGADYDRILVRINSPGGDAFEGISIYNILAGQGKPVDVIVDGLAASAASVIAMAGATRTMNKGAMLMAHNAWSMVAGEAKDLRKMADTLEKLSGSIADIYAAVTGRDDVQALMDAETWMTATEAVSMGFATAEGSTASDTALNLARSFKSLSAMKCVPENLKPAAVAETAGPEPGESNLSYYKARWERTRRK
jgi:ATP-dependent Clp protease protease subunit